MKYVFSAKIWFVKTSTRIVKHKSRVVRSNPDCLTASKGKPIEKIWGGGGGGGGGGANWVRIVGKGGHTPHFLDQPPFSKIPPFLEIQDVPTFHRFIGKTKELNNCYNQFVYNFYPQSILILEECLQK